MKDINKIKKIDFPCPCGGKIKWFKERVIQEGIDCGILDVETCNKCGTQYLPDWSMEIVEKKLKEANLWGCGKKRNKILEIGEFFYIKTTYSNCKKIRAWKKPKRLYLPRRRT